ncbi:MAG TPA: hypothetical protein VGI45_32990 [Terracidiphilus sp.]
MEIERLGTETNTVPTFGVFAFVVTSRFGNIDPDEVLRYFSWTRYAIVAVVYTASVFWFELAKDGPFIFSRNNTRSKLQVLLAHAMFLTILLCGYRICTEIVPALPFWMTDTFRLKRSSRASFADIISCLVAFGMAYFERNWLYREPEIGGEGSEGSPPASWS